MCSVPICSCIRSCVGDLMNTFLVFTANTALLIALVCFIAYLCERAQDDDQWPQG